MMTSVTPNFQTTLISTFCIAFHIFVVGVYLYRDLKFREQVAHSSPGLRMTNFPWKGHGHFRGPILNF